MTTRKRQQPFPDHCPRQNSARALLLLRVFDPRRESMKNTKEVLAAAYEVFNAVHECYISGKTSTLAVHVLRLEFLSHVAQATAAAEIQIEELAKLELGALDDFVEEVSPDEKVVELVREEISAASAFEAAGAAAEVKRLSAIASVYRTALNILAASPKAGWGDPLGPLKPAAEAPPKKENSPDGDDFDVSLD